MMERTNSWIESCTHLLGRVIIFFMLGVTSGMRLFDLERPQAWRDGT